LIGPFYERDPTNVDYFGVQMSIPIPVFNIRTGEIQQRHATRQQVAYDIHRVEILIQQDIEAALDRLKNAQQGVKVYQEEVLPELRSGLERLRTLLQQGEMGVEALSIIDQQRKLLRSRDTYLDAQLELTQAQIDLAAAIADPLVLLPPMANSALAPLLPKP
jgi:cobalt-zinc-cadmium efflux system outer membrane protein